ncbi:MAG: S8 family serine peptidase [Myxococcota bacterium]
MVPRWIPGRPAAPALVLAAALVAGSGCIADTSDPPTPHDGWAAAAPDPHLQDQAAEATRAAVASRTLVRLTPGAPAEPFFEAVWAAGGWVEAWHPAAGIATARGLGQNAVRSVAGLPGVRGAAPDAVVRLDRRAGAPVAAPLDAKASGDPAEAAELARQWHLEAIGAPRAWDAQRLGTPEVTVAVLDTGIDAMHRELVGRVDDARSISLTDADDAALAARFPDRPAWTDLAFHGTHVASTVASNAHGAAGVTARTTLMAVKVLGMDGTGSYADVVRGILHATDEGADVINMSLGGPLSRTHHRTLIDALEDAVRYAVGRGVTLVAASGNDGMDLDADPDLYFAPCSAAGVICVGATGPAGAEGPTGPFENPDAVAPYANYGRAVDVAAPGGWEAPVWGACPGTSLVFAPCRGSDGYLVGLTGTSMAAPHASGLAALLVERRGRRPAAVRRSLERLSLDLGAPGRDPHYGHGRIDVPTALGLPLPDNFRDHYEPPRP